MQIRLSDYVAQKFQELGVSLVFMISGGGAMYLNDSIGKSHSLKYLCNHHEQAAAIGAEGYARISGKLGVVVVTTGPGGTNAVTGVMGQWLDSVPVLYISGQVKRETMVASYPNSGLRQLGDQEINIIDIVRPITKFCAVIHEPRDVRYLLEKAVHIACSGRPGPVWLDIPLDVQASLIDPRVLHGFVPEQSELCEASREKIDNSVGTAVEWLQHAKRPVFVAGHGIRIAGANEKFLQVVDQLQIPVVSTFNGCDLIPSEHPLYIGRMGTIGDRAGNLAVQNSDLLLCVGTRNNFRQISYNTQAFARCARKIIVDIDTAELNKPSIVPDLAINADAGVFLASLGAKYSMGEGLQIKEWLNWCKERQARYWIGHKDQCKVKAGVHPHYFARILSEMLHPGQVTVTGNGTVSIAWYQAATIKSGQRALWNSGCAAMGYDLPAAIGAALAENKQTPVICLAGDGSLQMNIQELETLAYHQLPIKLFVFNNGGYFSIQQTQKNFFKEMYVASNPESGVGIPNFCAIARAYGIFSMQLNSHDDLKDSLAEFIAQPGPGLCEVMISKEFEFGPKSSSTKLADGRMVSRPLEDMWPFLPRDEYLSNLLIPEWIE